MPHLTQSEKNDVLSKKLTSFTHRDCFILQHHIMRRSLPRQAHSRATREAYRLIVSLLF